MIRFNVPAEAVEAGWQAQTARSPVGQKTRTAGGEWQ
jgi:hypothetical protein